MGAAWRKILLFGRDGQLGGELHRRLVELGPVAAVGRQECDLRFPDAVRRLVREVRPALIVNAAAYSSVDGAEEEEELALAVNGAAPGILAEEAKSIGAFLVHYSTDYVFDGGKTEPYTEEDVPRPLNAYGRSKLAGEQAVLGSGAPCIVLRTSWLYGPRGRNFISRILALARENSELKVVCDEVGVPNWCAFVASAMVDILRQGAGSLRDRAGLYHLTSRGEASRYEVAERILGHFPELRERVRLIPVSSADFGAKAMRPRYSAMSPAKLEKVFGLRMPPWEEVLDAAVPELAKAKQGDGSAV